MINLVKFILKKNEKFSIKKIINNKNEWKI
jgi:hypothetical protein